MQEAQDGVVVMHDVDEETFMRFAHFAFAQTYPDPMPRAENDDDIKSMNDSENAAATLPVDTLDGNIIVGNNLSIMMLHARAKYLDKRIKSDEKATIHSQRRGLIDTDVDQGERKQATWLKHEWDNVNWEGVWYTRLFFNTYGVEEISFEEKETGLADHRIGLEHRRCADMCIPHVKVWIFCGSIPRRNASRLYRGLVGPYFG